MCSAISLSWRELPDELVDRYQLQDLRRTRPPKGDVEYHFFYRKQPAILPVWNEGQLRICNWSGYHTREQIEAGSWLAKQSQQVSVPATFVCDGGVWYPIKKDIQGLLVQNDVYLLTEPADHYHSIMCGTSRMVATE